MTSRRRQLVLPLCAFLLIAAAPAVIAQGAYNDDSTSLITTDAPAAKERKTTGWFRKPAAGSPKSQLKYANDLLEAGYIRDALKQYNALVCKWPEAAEAADAQFAYAKLLERTRKYEQAFEEYQYLIDFYPGTFPFDDVLDRQYTIANHVMTVRHGRYIFGRGYTTPERALPLFEQVVKNGRQWRNAAKAQFTVGLINEGQKDYFAAVRAYETTLVSYPGTPEANEAGYRRARCLYNQVDDAPRDEPTYREALSALSIYLRDYPKSQYAPEAQRLLDNLKDRLAQMYFERAEYYDRIARRPQSAVIAYTDFIRNFPTSELAQEASDRIDALNSKGEKK